MHHLWEVFRRLKEHNLKFHLGKCRVFHTQVEYLCCNPSLRLATKVRVCKVAGQEGSSKITSSALGSANECEGMNPHTPK
jgi:hypothetical protein